MNNPYKYVDKDGNESTLYEQKLALQLLESLGVDLFSTLAIFNSAIEKLSEPMKQAAQDARDKIYQYNKKDFDNDAEQLRIYREGILNSILNAQGPAIYKIPPRPEIGTFQPGGANLDYNTFHYKFAECPEDAPIEVLQWIMDYVGIIPVYGDFVDILSAGIYFARDMYIMGIIQGAFAAIPAA